jgi:lysophospholipase L1-like esterase
MTPTAEWIAVGDSFTAGTGDDPREGGWIHRTAAAVTRAGRVASFQNHAVAGARIDDVLQRQLPLVQGRARVISAIAGANDILDRRCSVSAVAERADRLIDWALGRAEIVLTCTCPNFVTGRAVQLRRLASRIDTLNQHVERRRRETASLVVIDAYRILTDPGLWADDGIHANPHGHKELSQVATEVLLTRLR